MGSLFSGFCAPGGHGGQVIVLSNRIPTHKIRTHTSIEFGCTFKDSSCLHSSRSERESHGYPSPRRGGNQVGNRRAPEFRGAEVREDLLEPHRVCWNSGTYEQTFSPPGPLYSRRWSVSQGMGLMGMVVNSRLGSGIVLGPGWRLGHESLLFKGPESKSPQKVASD